MTLQVDEWGDGPPVLLIHGIPHPVSDFTPIVERLKGRYRVIAPYLPGFGASARLTPYSFAAVRDAIVQVIAERQAFRLAIVGYSLGGVHALALALDPRLQVTRVVALATLARYPDADRELMQAFSAQLHAGPDLRTAEWRSIAAQRFTASAEHGETVADWLMSTRPEVIADNVDAMLAEDLRPRLASIAVPVFLRVGTADISTPPAESEAIAAACPNATVELAAGVGHAMILEDPAGTAEFVARALASA